MATAKKRKLSGSTDGLAIEVIQTDSPGDVIHQAVAGTTPGTFDEIWLWASNTHTAEVELTLEFGGLGSPPDKDNIIVTIPAKAGLVPVVPGLILQNGSTVEAYAEVAGVIGVFGFVNTITD